MAKPENEQEHMGPQNLSVRATARSGSAETGAAVVRAPSSEDDQGAASGRAALSARDAPDQRGVRLVAAAADGPSDPPPAEGEAAQQATDQAQDTSEEDEARSQPRRSAPGIGQVTDIGSWSAASPKSQGPGARTPSGSAAGAFGSIIPMGSQDSLQGRVVLGIAPFSEAPGPRPLGLSAPPPSLPLGKVPEPVMSISPEAPVLETRPTTHEDERTQDAEGTPSAVPAAASLELAQSGTAKRPQIRSSGPPAEAEEQATAAPSAESSPPDMTSQPPSVSTSMLPPQPELSPSGSLRDLAAVSARPRAQEWSASDTLPQTVLRPATGPHSVAPSSHPSSAPPGLSAAPARASQSGGPAELRPSFAPEQTISTERPARFVLAAPSLLLGGVIGLVFGAALALTYGGDDHVLRTGDPIPGGEAPLVARPQARAAEVEPPVRADVPPPAPVAATSPSIATDRPPPATVPLSAAPGAFGERTQADLASAGEGWQGDPSPARRVPAEITWEEPAKKAAEAPVALGRPQQVLRRAVRLIRKDHPAQAERLLRPLLRRRPHNHHVKEALIKALLAQGRGAEGVELAQEIVRKRRRRASYRVILGRTLSAAGDSEGARAAFRKALELDPNNRWARRYLR